MLVFDEIRNLFLRDFVWLRRGSFQEGLRISWSRRLWFYYVYSSLPYYSLEKNSRGVLKYADLHREALDEYGWCICVLYSSFFLVRNSVVNRRYYTAVVVSLLSAVIVRWVLTRSYVFPSVTWVLETISKFCVNLNFPISNYMISFIRFRRFHMKYSCKTESSCQTFQTVSCYGQESSTPSAATPEPVCAYVLIFRIPVGRMWWTFVLTL